MMKKNLLTFLILLFLCFVNFKANANTETVDQKTLSSEISKKTINQQIKGIHLKGTDVKVNINGSIAEVTVRQKFKNETDKIISGRYMFPAPAKALVHGIQMTANEKNFKADVKERKSARGEFIRLKEEGKNALLVKQDSSNLFSINLANVMPGETVDVDLKYMELLIPIDMKYEFKYPVVSSAIFTDQTEAEFDIEVNISESIPVRQVLSSTHNIKTINKNESGVKVILKDSDKTVNKGDYVLNYRLEGKKMPAGLILSGGKDENFLLFNENIGSPGLKDISVKFTDLKTYDLEPSVIPDLKARRPVTVLAKWKGEANGLIKVEGRRVRDDYSKTYRFVKNNDRNTYGNLKHLWAGKRIERLADFNTGNGGINTKSEITDLGLQYSLLTGYTSFLAYNDVVRKPVTRVAEVKEPLPLPLPEEKPEPAPVMIAKVPEPEFYILLLILSSVVLAGTARRKMSKVLSRTAEDKKKA